MNAIAPLFVFSLLIGISILGATIAAIILLVLIVQDALKGKLW